MKSTLLPIAGILALVTAAPLALAQTTQSTQARAACNNAAMAWLRAQNAGYNKQRIDAQTQLSNDKIQCRGNAACNIRATEQYVARSQELASGVNLASAEMRKRQIDCTLIAQAPTGDVFASNGTPSTTQPPIQGSTEVNVPVVVPTPQGPIILRPQTPVYDTSQPTRPATPIILRPETPVFDATPPARPTGPLQGGTQARQRRDTLPGTVDTSGPLYGTSSTTRLPAMIGQTYFNGVPIQVSLASGHFVKQGAQGQVRPLGGGTISKYRWASGVITGERMFTIYHLTDMYNRNVPLQSPLQVPMSSARR